MEFLIEQNNNGYFLKISDNHRYTFLDRNISNLLHIPFKEYINILIQHHAYKTGLLTNECFFKNEKDIKNLIKFLESYLILEKLTE